MGGALCHVLSLGISNEASTGWGNRVAAVLGFPACANVCRLVTIVVGAGAVASVGVVTVIPPVCETVEDF